MHKGSKGSPQRIGVTKGSHQDRGQVLQSNKVLSQAVILQGLTLSRDPERGAAHSDPVVSRHMEEGPWVR